MTTQAQPSQAVLSRPSAIDPARAWILGIVVEDDGQFRPVPAAGSPELTARTWDDETRPASDCTCPDYCEVEHDLV